MFSSQSSYNDCVYFLKNYKAARILDSCLIDRCSPFRGIQTYYTQLHVTYIQAYVRVTIYRIYVCICIPNQIIQTFRSIHINTNTHTQAKRKILNLPCPLLAARKI